MSKEDYIIPEKTIIFQKLTPLSDDEKLAIIRKWSEEKTMRAQDLIGLCDAIEKAIMEKNK